MDRLESQHQNKLVHLHDSMDKDFNAKIKRFSDKERVLENEKTRVEDVGLANPGFGRFEEKIFRRKTILGIKSSGN